mmetsp:Transcript_23564/g.34885  ORF Transcript_23564/g.34885 Transcript_23564/m.34885 type:complete len:118 (-) Transcript_23564:747-1100(-)
MAKRKRDESNQDDAGMVARKNQPGEFDTNLWSQLPRGIVEDYIIPCISHVFTSKEQLIKAVDDYVHTSTVHTPSVTRLVTGMSLRLQISHMYLTQRGIWHWNDSTQLFQMACIERVR